MELDFPEAVRQRRGVPLQNRSRVRRVVTGNLTSDWPVRKLRRHERRVPQVEHCPGQRAGAGSEPQRSADGRVSSSVQERSSPRGCHDEVANRKGHHSTVCGPEPRGPQHRHECARWTFEKLDGRCAPPHERRRRIPRRVDDDDLRSNAGAGALKRVQAALNRPRRVHAGNDNGYVHVTW